jgi:hypothetical protein
MLCLCSQQLALLPKLAVSVNLSPGIPLPPFLPSLSAALGVLASANLKLGLPALPPLPPLPGLDAVLAFGGAALALKGIGIDVTAPNASAQLALLAGSAALHLPALPKINIAGLLPVLQIALAVQMAKGLGLNLLLPGFKLPSLPPLALTLGAGAGAWLGLASLAATAKLAFGIDLALPGAALKLQAMLQLMARLALPTLALDLPALSAWITLGSTLATVQAALGINLALPGAALQLAALLKPLLSLNLSLGMPALPLAGLLGLNISAMAALAAALHLALPLPNLAPFAMLASLTAAFQPLGIGLLKAGCPICTFL